MDIETAALVGEVFDRINAVEWNDHATLDSLRENWPDGHYVWTTHERLSPLVDAFIRLNLVDRMLAMDALPLPTPIGSISRAEWLRIVLELTLTRLSGIRDLCALLTANVYELELPSHQVTVPRLLRDPILREDAGVLLALKAVAGTEVSLRAERNRLLHEGQRRSLGILDVAARLEAYKVDSGGPADSDSPGGCTSSGVPEMFFLNRDAIAAELETGRTNLLKASYSLLQELFPVWRKRFDAKIAQRNTIGGRRTPETA